MKRTCRACLRLVLLLVASGVASAIGPEVGQSAPRIEIAQWLSSGVNGAAPLAGRIVVLEFWATWCRPCRDMLPHMNELADRFTKDGVVFVSMSDEAPERVESFMQSYAMRTRVVLDRDEETHRRYAVQTIPTMYLIDGSGIVKWKGHPAEFDEVILANLVKGVADPALAAPAPPAPPAPAEPQSPASPPTPTEPDVSIIVKYSAPSSEHAQSTESNVGQVTVRFTRYTVAEVLGSLLDYSPTRVRVPEYLVGRPMDLVAYVPAPIPAEETRKRVAAAFCRNLGLTMDRVTERLACHIVTSPHLKAPISRSSALKLSQGATGSLLSGASMKDLAEYIERRFGEVTIDETHRSSRYELTVPAGDYASTRVALEADYGIRMADAPRKIDLLVLTVQGSKVKVQSSQ